MKEQQLELFYDKKEQREKLHRRRYTIEIPLDVVVLINIIIIFSFAVAFSLGVEKGKKIAISHDKYRPEVKTYISKRKQSLDLGKKDKETTSLVKKLKEKGGNKYIVQVASYLKEDIAHKEKEYLEKTGFSAELSRKGKYIVLFVGSFSSKKEAEKIKNLLEKRYSDCFIKRRL